MSLPSDESIQSALLRFLMAQPDKEMHCCEVYGALAEHYPQITESELKCRYRNSRSHWANRVQFAVEHLRQKGLVCRPFISGRGIWALTKSSDEGSAVSLKADEMLEELRRTEPAVALRPFAVLSGLPQL